MKPIKSGRKLLKQKRIKNLCVACGLYRSADVNTHYVPTEYNGDKPVKILIVGEGPGKTEDIEGRPFAGLTGDLIREAVIEVFGSEDDIAYSNVTRCRPTDANGKNRPPTRNEGGRCVQYLWDDIRRLKPKVIVALGSSALKYICGVDKKIFSVRGKEFKAYVDGDEYRVICTLHPAYALHVAARAEDAWDPEDRLADQATKNLIKADLRKAHWGNPHPNEKSVMLTTLQEVKLMVKRLLKSKSETLGYDAETRNLNKRYDNPVLTFQFCNGNTSYIVPWDHPESPFREGYASDELRGQVRGEIAKLFQAKKPGYKRIVAHNAKFDLQVLYRVGITHVSVPVVCTILAAHLMNENRKVRNPSFALKPFSLDVLAEEKLSRNKYQDTVSKSEVSRLETVSLERVGEYGGSDALLARELFIQFQREAKQQSFYRKFMRLSDHLLARTSLVLSVLEYNGFPVDLRALSTMMNPRTSAIQQRIQDIDVNVLRSMPSVIEANKVLVPALHHGMRGLFSDPWVFDFSKRLHSATLFFQVLGLEPIPDPKKDGDEIPEFSLKEKIIPTVGKPFKQIYENVYKRKSDSESDIVVPGEDGLYYQYPEVALFTERDSLLKCQNSFVKKIWMCTHPNSDSVLPDHRDGRIRASFSGHSTVTGRNASGDPFNAQQVPRADSPAKKAVKNLFTAVDGYWLINVDFKVAEVRWLAISSGDPILCEAFIQSKQIRDEFLRNPTPEMKERASLLGDVHRQNAALFYSVLVEEVTKELRQDTKTIVFGRIYGRGAKAIAPQIGKSVEETKRLLQEFDERYHVSMTYMQNQTKQARETGYVESLLGRRRRLYWFFQTDDHGRIAMGERRAVNAPIQAIASDANNIATAEIIKYVNKHELDWIFHNVVHDSCILSISMEYDLMECLQAIEWFYTVRLEQILVEDFRIDLKAPLEVDFDIGLRWGDLTSWDGTRGDMDSVQRIILAS